MQSGDDEATAGVPVVDGQRNRLRGAQLPRFGFGQCVPAVAQWRRTSGEARDEGPRGTADIRTYVCTRECTSSWELATECPPIQSYSYADILATSVYAPGSAVCMV